MDRSALLDMWSKNAPGECEPGSPGIWRIKLDQTMHFLGGRSASARAVILAALIQNIGGRGWLYTLTNTDSDFGAATHQAAVIREDNGLSEARADQPCDALLAAYVRALEQTKGESS